MTKADSALTPEEEANLKAVDDFIAAWDTPRFDAAKALGQYFTDDCLIRISHKFPFLEGQAAAAAAIQPYYDSGMLIKVRYFSKFARGPLVTNYRVDIIDFPGKPTEEHEMFGAFTLRDGKIHEWFDYTVG